MASRTVIAALVLGLVAWGSLPAGATQGPGQRVDLPAVAPGLLHPEPGLYVLEPRPGAGQCVRVDEDVAKASALPPSAVVLVHGLDDSGEVWRVLAPALSEAGRVVLFYEYPNDQGIALSADGLAGALRLARGRGVERIDLVCHSMGGLVARDVLTRAGMYGGQGDGHADLPDVDRMILIGTPNAGSALAHIRDAGEVVERTIAWRQAEAPLTEIFAFESDGDGQAGIDLRPGSAFLEDLNARAAPVGVITTVIVAQAVGQSAIGADAEVGAVPEGEPVRRGVRARLRSWWTRVVARVVEALGDGAVSTASASLEHADETLLVRCTHVGLLKEDPVGGWVLDAVGAERQEAPAVDLVLERVASGPAGGR